MKKHIQKKFLHEKEFSVDMAEALTASGIGIPIDENLNMEKLPEGKALFITTEDNKIFKAFSFRHQQKLKLIPEPDPILVYFHAAYMNYIQIDKNKKEILDKLSQEKMNEVMIKELYDYFGVTSSFVILLFTAIEALMNRCIGKDYIYKKTTTKKTELYSKKQIEQFFPFDDKLNKVLTESTNKSFSKQHPLKYAHITNLKEFRDMIVHTKEAEEESTYDYLYRKALTFNYGDTIDAVKDFCNFYTKPDFIIECNCNQDF